VRFTLGGDGALHAILLGTPADPTVELLGVRPADGATVELLGFAAPLRWTATDRGVAVDLPGRLSDAPAHALRLAGASVEDRA
jgi:hypothetical protein